MNWPIATYIKTSISYLLSIRRYLEFYSPRLYIYIHVFRTRISWEEPSDCSDSGLSGSKMEERRAFNLFFFLPETFSFPVFFCAYSLLNQREEVVLHHLQNWCRLRLGLGHVRRPPKGYLYVFRVFPASISPNIGLQVLTSKFLIFLQRLAENIQGRSLHSRGKLKKSPKYSSKGVIQRNTFRNQCVFLCFNPLSLNCIQTKL